MIKRIPYLLLVVLMTACSSIDCPVDATVTTQYQIKNSDGTEHTLSDTMTVTSVRSDGKDTILYNKGIGISKDYPHFESVDCNTTYFHTITDVKYTCNYIDSIVINNSSVTYDSQTVHLYLYPKSND